MEPEVETVYPSCSQCFYQIKLFKNQFGHLSGSWRGKKPLQRNAIIALANLGDRTALPAIWRCK